MKKRFLVTMALVAVMLLAFASTASAATITATPENGWTSSTEFQVRGKTFYKDPGTGKTLTESIDRKAATLGDAVALAGGYAGTPSASGYRYVYIRNNYSYWGQWALTYESRYLFYFSGGRVTAFYNMGDFVTKRNNWFYRWVGSWCCDPPVPLPNGGYFSWYRARLQISSPLIGDIYEVNPKHEIYAYGNGTWYWNIVP